MNKRDLLKPSPQSCRPRGAAILFVAAAVTGGTILYSGCGLLAVPAYPIKRAMDAVQKSSARRQPPVPESEWNKTGLWERVGEAPATWIPKGYGRSTPRTEAQGTWYTDKRDGKRLFVPGTMVRGIRPGVFEGEAIKATNWQSEKSMPGIREQPVRSLAYP